MNFLKISGLVIGTGSVVGGTGAGIYYVANKKNIEEDINKDINKENKNIEFDGKLVFFKKSGENENTIYEAKLLAETEYNTKIKEFNSNKTDDNEKHEAVNKAIDISKSLNIEETENKLNEIFEMPSSLSDIKAKITSKATELKKLFGDTIYENLKTKLES